VQAEPEGTRRKILQAAIETLREDGFVGATSRAVATRGGFNPALIFYYYGSMDALLLAALDLTSEQRLIAYREAVSRASDIGGLMAAAKRLYQEDRESGHITVVSQMIAGSIARPELAPEMILRMQPWIALCEEAFGPLVADTPFATVEAEDLAYAVVTFYLGVNLLTQLDPDRTRTDSLFSRIDELEPIVSALLQSQSDTRR